MRYLSFGRKASVVIGDLTFTAVDKGVAGNGISIVLADTESAGAATITSVALGVITIGIEAAVTTCNTIIAAIEADKGEGGAAELITAVAATGKGTAAQAAAEPTFLTGGLDEGVPFIALGGIGYSGNRTMNHATETVAGVAYRLKSDGTLSTAVAHGYLKGVSLGVDPLTGKSKICTKGLSVPIRLTAGYYPDVGEVVFINDVTGYACAEGDDGTASNAVYRTGIMSGEVERGVEVPVALIDMTAGL